MNKIFVFILVQIFFIRSVIIDNCLRTTNSTDRNKSTCLSCRDGFFPRLGVCTQCSTLTSSPQCNLTKSNSFASVPNQPTNQSTILDTNASKIFINGSVVGSNADSFSNQTMLNDRLKLENCKDVDKNGRCINCFNNYYKNVDGICIKDQTQLQSNQLKMGNCLVYSQVQAKCLFCQDNYIIGLDNICKLDSSPQLSTNGTSLLQGTSQLLLAKNDKVGTLTLDSNETSSNLTNANNSKVKSDGQISFVSSQNLLKLTNSTNQTLKFNNLNSSFISTGSSNGKKITLIIDKSSSENSQLPQVTEVDYQTCLESIPQSKACIKCIIGYILNPLLNKCVILNKPIDLNSTIQRTIRVDDKNISISIPNISNSNSKINNNLTSNSSASGNVNSGISISANNTQITNKSNNIANSSINGTSISQTNKNLINATNSTVPTAVTSSTSNTKNVSSTTTSNTNSTTTSSSSKNSTNSTNIAGSSAVINGTTSNASNSGSTNTTTKNVGVLLGTSLSANSSSGTVKYNVTTSVDPKTGLTITIIGTTTNPPTSAKIKYCIKYKDISYECVQCETFYNIFQGKCYDSFEFSQLSVNKKIIYGNNVLG